jgi:hypothetical protein
MPWSVKIRSIAAAFLFAGVLYIWYWAYGHGGFSSKGVEIPIEIVQGRSVNVRFSVPEAGDHYVMIAYPKGEVDPRGKALEAITGKAILSLGGTLLTETELPVDHQTSTRDYDAMVLFTLPTEPYKQYTLSLQITRLPPALIAAHPAMRVELDGHYMFIVWQVELLGFLMVVAAILCGIPVVRRIRTKSKSNTRTV